MGRLAKIALALAAVAVAGVAAFAFWLARLDVSTYRGTIEEAAEDATGRRLELAGAMDLAIGLRPSLVIEDVRFANASFGSRPEMARLKRLEVQVELLPLLAGEIRVNRLVLVEPDILLETDPEGNGNWMLTAATDEGATPPSPSATTPPRSPAAAIPLVDEIRLERATLVFVDGRRGERQVLAIEELEATAGSLDGPLELSVRGSWQETGLELAGTIGPLAALPDRARPLAVDLRGTVSTLGAIGLSTRVEGDLARKIRLEDLSVRLGEDTATGRLEARLDGPRPRVAGTLSASRVVLPRSDAEPSSRPSPSDTSRRGGRVFPQDRLPLEGLRAVDLDLELAATEIAGSADPLRDVEARVRLENGALAVEPFAFAFADSRVTGRLSLDASTTPPELAVELDARGMRLDALLDQAARESLRDGRTDFSIRLRGRGASPAAIAASLGGETKLLVGRMRAKTDLLDVAVGGSSRILGMLFAEKKEWSTIHCVASNLRFRNGVATPDVLLVDTEYSTIVGEGAIDLGAETLDLKISPEPKEITLSVAVPIRVGGTLAKPTYRPDELATVKKIGGLLSIAFFPPAALASLAELGSSENPCLVLAAGGRPAEKKGITDTARAAGGTIASGAGAGAKKIGEGLKSLFGD